MRAKILLLLLIMPFCMSATILRTEKRVPKHRKEYRLKSSMTCSDVPLIEVEESNGQLYFNLYYPMSSADIIIKDCRNAVVYEEHDTEIYYGRTIVILFVEGEDISYSYEVTSGEEYIIGEVVWEEE